MIFNLAGGGGDTPIPSGGAFGPDSFTYTGEYEYIDDSEATGRKGDFRIKFYTSGILTFDKVPPKGVDVFLVGGGGAGGYFAGGAGGFTLTKKNITAKKVDAYTIEVGAGGVYGSTKGGSSTAFGFAVEGGDTSTTLKGNTERIYGGSGGGGCSLVNNDTAYSGAGGSDGSNGLRGTSAQGSLGQGTTTREFGEEDGDLYAGGGGGMTNYTNLKNYGAGGAGGGGRGGRIGQKPGATYGPKNGEPNTGGGGGGGAANNGNGSSGSGGSGIVIIRNARG